MEAITGGDFWGIEREGIAGDRAGGPDPTEGKDGEDRGSVAGEDAELRMHEGGVGGLIPLDEQMSVKDGFLVNKGAGDGGDGTR